MPRLSLRPECPACSPVLLTGGLGYIGAHVAVVLLGAGYEVAIVDNLVNSSAEVSGRIADVAGRRPRVFDEDVRDLTAMRGVLETVKPRVVIHLAALKSVAESVVAPLDYYDVNVGGSIVLLKAMAEAGVSRFVFSSSAAVYGAPGVLPVAEDAPLAPENPYGDTKLQVETLLRSLCAADPGFRAIALRYFNPVGGHPSGLLGEDPRGAPANLMPYLVRVAQGKARCLRVFGSDYPTPDGTGVRDYLHVMDLAEGHLAALSYLDSKVAGFVPVNLGAGRGLSVLELVRAFETAAGREIPLELHSRRAGDAPACYADVTRATALFGWRARRDVAAMCSDSWRLAG